MANEKHLAILKQGWEAWSQWREKNPNIQLNLAGANLTGMFFGGGDFSRAILSGANLTGATVVGAIFHGADFSFAQLTRATVSSTAILRNVNLTGADLTEADLSGAVLNGATLDQANLARANLTRTQFTGASLIGASLSEANLEGAFLSKANLSRANISRTNLNRARLTKADLTRAVLTETVLKSADLTGCKVYGISAWDVDLAGAIQSDLVITRENEPTITVDNLEVAQFIYLLLRNEKIRDIIDTITTKVVLILGRFTPERKAILDAIRDELRKRDYIPLLFDFEKPTSRDFTETVRTLAHLARFVIADITEPRSISQELQAIVPGLAVPVQPLLLEDSTGEYGMFQDLPKKYHWVLAVHRYGGLDDLLVSLEEKVIVPAEAKVKELEAR